MPILERRTGHVANPAPAGGTVLLTSRLVRAATVLGRITAQVHKADFGLSGSEFSVIVALGNAAGEPLTSSQIVETTAMDKTKVSRAVSSLDQRGWLGRTRATEDRRFEFLQLTNDGLDFFDALMPRLLTAERAILAQMPKAEREGLERGLAALDEAMVAAAADGPKPR